MRRGLLALLVWVPIAFFVAHALAFYPSAHFFLIFLALVTAPFLIWWLVPARRTRLAIALFVAVVVWVPVSLGLALMITVEAFMSQEDTWAWEEGGFSPGQLFAFVAVFMVLLVTPFLIWLGWWLVRTRRAEQTTRMPGQGTPAP